MYFNDNEPFVVEWLRRLWPDAIVDGRSVTELRPEDLTGHDRVHLYAGIGGWQYALELAGWDATPVWTASLPCQPFSSAGKRRGTDDARHLWPVTRDLIEQCRPPVIFGEQVASRLGREWLAGVRTDLEALGYAVGAADLCAASVGAPHIRQRLYWVAYSECDRLDRTGTTGQAGRNESPDGGVVVGMGNGLCSRLEGYAGHEYIRRESGWVIPNPIGSTRSPNRPWDDFDLLYCRDNKVRRIEPGSFPLAHGVPARVGRIRAYGGAIVPQLAATFIRALREAVIDGR